MFNTTIIPDVKNVNIKINIFNINIDIMNVMIENMNLFDRSNKEINWV